MDQIQSLLFDGAICICMYGSTAEHVRHDGDIAPHTVEPYSITQLTTATGHPLYCYHTLTLTSGDQL